MKLKNYLAILLIVLLSSFYNHQTKKKIVFFGDSITQMGVGPKGYITRMGQLLNETPDGKNVDLIGAGIGGNKVYDLYLRMDDDVLAKNPDIVVIWVGVNDVWHKRTYGTGTDQDKFEKFYNAVIKKLKAQNIQVYLCTPATIGEKTDFSNELDGDLNQYATIIRKIARDNNCPLIDLRKAFLSYLLSNNPENKTKGILTTDGVHLNDTGNDLVAHEMLKVIALR